VLKSKVNLVVKRPPATAFRDYIVALFVMDENDIWQQFYIKQVIY
jgi:hypothetical protein